MLGLSFKAGTDDLRESPTVALIERLIGKGYEVRIYDRNVSLARIVGANKAYIEDIIPHISSLMVPSIDDILAHAEIIVVGNDSAEFSRVLQDASPSQQIVDLVRIAEDIVSLNDNYSGICW